MPAGVLLYSLEAGGVGGGRRCNQAKYNKQV